MSVSVSATRVIASVVGKQITVKTARPKVGIQVVGVQGPPGRDGTGGTGGAGGSSAYLHTQSAASSTWIINHNLGFRPTMIAVEDLFGNGIDGFLTEHVSNVQTRLSFNPALAGRARLL